MCLTYLYFNRLTSTGTKARDVCYSGRVLSTSLGKLVGVYLRRAIAKGRARVMWRCPLWDQILYQVERWEIALLTLKLKKQLK